jgi:minor histocompatibility antigen H13
MSSEDASSVSLVTSITPFLPTYVHLVVAALFPIYTASYSSLRRPLNTLSPKQLKALRPSKSSSTSASDDGGVDEHESSSHVEQLTASDAMMFPVTAGAVLGGLYLLIKYLDDPTLLSRALTWYFCAMGVFAIGKAFADGLGVIVGFVFPHRIRNDRGQLFLASYDCWKVRGADTEVAAPIPGMQVPAFLNNAIWSARRTLRARWILHLKTGGEPTRKPFWIGDLVGPVIGTAVVGIYVAGGKHWLLTNIMGMSFSYGAMQVFALISPAYPVTYQVHSSSHPPPFPSLRSS